ncbi:archease [Candidatus Woesearchaeota archaeon]|nr:archease [Candidatus Woesearchaeota archaeon]
MKYRFLPHTADIIFEAYGNTVERVFENSGLALEEIMVSTSTLNTEEHYEITLKSNNLENLLYDFLSELIFVKDTEGLLFKKFDIVIMHKKKEYELIAKCEGEKINHEKHELHDDAKAITMHEFKIKKEKNIWKTHVLVDI